MAGYAGCGRINKGFLGGILPEATYEELPATKRRNESEA